MRPGTYFSQFLRVFLPIGGSDVDGKSRSVKSAVNKYNFRFREG